MLFLSFPSNLCSPLHLITTRNINCALNPCQHCYRLQIHTETIISGLKCNTIQLKGLWRPVQGVLKVTKAPNKGDRERTRDNERELGLGVKEGNDLLSTTMYKGVYKLQRHKAVRWWSVHWVRGLCMHPNANELERSSSRIKSRLRVLWRASESFGEWFGSWFQRSSRNWHITLVKRPTWRSHSLSLLWLC